MMVMSSTDRNDGGQTFEPIVDLRNNTGFSFNRQMALADNNVYVLWDDTTNGGDFNIFYRTIIDNGKNLSPIIDLSKNTGNSFNQQIVSGNNK